MKTGPESDADRYKQLETAGCGLSVWRQTLHIGVVTVEVSRLASYQRESGRRQGRHVIQTVGPR